MIFLPLLPLATLRLGSHSTPPKHDKNHPTTHDVLLLTLADLHSIHALLPPSPLPSVESVYSRFRLLGPLRLVRGLVVLWSSWIVLGRLFGYSTLQAFLGTIILLLPSPFLAQVVDLLSRSLAIRRLTALSFLLVFGSPPDHSYPISLNFSPAGWIKTKWATSRRPSLAFTFKPKAKLDQIPNESAIIDDEDDTAAPIYFRFEVHENQRWWMGLDWTSALLPQERPSWCDSHLLPVSPPASFPLPSSSSIVLPHPTKTDPDGRVRRVAEWKWLDDDWSVVRAGPGLGNLTMPIAPSPTIPDDEHSGFHIPAQRNSIASLGSSPPTASNHEEGSVGARAQSIAEQAFTKGLERLKARTTSPTGTASRTQSMIIGGSPQRTSGEFKRGRTGSQASEDFKDLEVHTGSAPLVTETIVEKDDVSPYSMPNLTSRSPMLKVGCTVITSGRVWVQREGWARWVQPPCIRLLQFTRRRRWHRRAVLTEVVIRLPSEPPTNKGSSELSPTLQTPLKSKVSIAPQTILAESRPSPIVEESDPMAFTKERRRSSSSSKGPSIAIPPGSPARDDVLRQRLKKVMGNVGG